VAGGSGPNRSFKAVLWDFGGVLTESPFIAFARFEQARGLPRDFLRRVNSLATDTNA
jgi:putative hydrolase of the HAD superfamily